MDKKIFKTLIALIGPVSFLLVVLHLTYSGIQSYQPQGIGGPVPLPDRLIPLNGIPNPAWRALNTTGDLQAQRDGMWIGRSSTTANVVFSDTVVGGVVSITGAYPGGLWIYGDDSHPQLIDAHGANIVGGYIGNWIGTTNVPDFGNVGNVVLGGIEYYELGTLYQYPNYINMGNTSGGLPYGGAAVVGGWNNSAMRRLSGVFGGSNNSTNAEYGLIAGGFSNLTSISSTLMTRDSIIGSSNAIQHGYVGGSLILGGTSSIQQGTSSSHSVVQSVIAGGQNNKQYTTDAGYWNCDGCTIIGGANSVITNTLHGTIIGSGESTIYGNLAGNEQSAIIAGDGNTLYNAEDSAIIASDTSTIASSRASVIIGSDGGSYINNGDYDIVLSGYNVDITNADYAAAGGRRAKVNHSGSFVWADSSDADFSTDRADQFKVRASGGSLFNQDSTTATLPVLELDQDDTNESFINYIGTSTADQLSSISTVNGDGVVDGPRNAVASPGWTFKGMVRIEINGVEYWMPFYSAEVP